MSPKFRQQNGYTFKIFSNEEERMHVHVLKDNKEAKIWLEPLIKIAHNNGFNEHEMSQILKITEEYGEQFKQLYAKHIGKRVDD